VNLRWRVGLAGGAVVLGTLAAVSAIVYPALTSQLHAQLDAALVEAAKAAPLTLQEIKARLAATQGDGVPAFNKPLNLGSSLLQVVDPADPAAGGELAPVDQHDLAVADGTGPPYFREVDYRGQRYRLYTTLLSGKGGDRTLVRVARPLTEQQATLNRLRLLLVGLTLAGTAGAAAVARLAAGRVLHPVGRLTDAVERVTATQDLTASMPAGGRDEIGRLAGSFAAMMAALDGSVRAQRQLVADASHELRTPLTSLTTNLELLDEPAGTADPQAPALVHAAREQAGELTVLVNDLVELSRYGQVELHTEDTRLDLLAEQAVRRAAARTTAVRFETRLTPTQVRADPDAVERAIGNLLDNAVKWSPPDGRILVAVAAGEVTVTDDGPGIPAEDLPHIFDRFYRSPTARALPGSGLGLAIVRQIAETHGGRVTAEPQPRGVRLRLSLPTAPRPAG